MRLRSAPKKSAETQLLEPQRRLSPWRVMLGLLIIVAVGAGSAFAMQQLHAPQTKADRSPWFASYVDVTATPRFAFEQMGATANRDALLAFVVSSTSDACTPTWGGAYTLEQANGSLDLDRRIARLQQQGGSVAVSFGGRINDELALKCTDETKLRSAYQAVIDRYNLDTIDLDLENAGLTDQAAAARRATVIAALQAARRHDGKNLAVWVTLPVAPQGLTVDGTNAVEQLLSHGVDLAGVNVMTMDYGESREKGQTMLAASEDALQQTVRQLGILYERNNIHLNSKTVWSKVGATPMIGQNDFEDEVFTLDDAKALNQFALDQHIGRMSMWSANRDIACGSNYVYVKVVSDSCSGIAQSGQEFASLLSNGFDGTISLSASVITVDDPTSASASLPDDPKTSPYQIWSGTGAYLAGTKVVWHHNVYRAKWWTQGDTPDNPVLQAWQTPWELVGPVLPGEKPIPQPTLPAGTYPGWKGTVAYNASDRVLFNGIPYQAKWWNQGDSPAAASSDPNGSPWAPLTQAQINEIEAKNKSTE